MRVKLKTWEQMEQEWGLTSDGDINCIPMYIAEMERLCPEDRIIEVKSIENGFMWKGKWRIERPMIEEVIDEDYDNLREQLKRMRQTMTEIAETLMDKKHLHAGYCLYIDSPDQCSCWVKEKYDKIQEDL